MLTQTEPVPAAADILGWEPSGFSIDASARIALIDRDVPSYFRSLGPGPIRKIREALGEPLEPPPLAPARGPPTDWGELVQTHDDRAIFQASPDELPVIAIHSL